MTADLGDAGGFTIVSYDVLDSTNEEMKRLAATGGAGHGTVVQARTQSAGRGRRGRTWVSEPGNLYCSLFLRRERPLAESAQLSFVTAVAVAEAIEGFLGQPGRVSCKWPNDVLIERRKVAGILLETVGGGDSSGDGVIVGVGLNIARCPDDTAYPATSLAACGAEAVAVERVLHAVCRAFAPWYAAWLADGFAPVRAAWLAKASGLGEDIRGRLGSETLGGVFEGLDADGALILREGNGNRRQITAGDVYFDETALQRVS